MYAYERFNGILKSFVRNRAYPEGCMVQEYCTEEAVEWALNYGNPSNPIGVPKSHDEGRLTGKGTIGKKAIAPDPHLFCCTHFHVLQQMSIMSEYLNGHKEVLLRDNLGCNESWLANEIFNVVTYQGYNINGYTFYTEQQDKKSTHQNSGVRVDAYDVTGQDKNTYYSQIQEIWELDFHSFKIPLFYCNWVDAINGVV
jgi:hypothetical protein